MKLKLIIFLLIGFIIYFIIGSIYLDKKGKERFDEFYKANLDGKLERVGIGMKGSVFKIIGTEKEYLFFPQTNEILNESNTFVNFAKPGDKIFKPSFSDTLQLLKDGKIYKYTFKKF